MALNGSITSSHILTIKKLTGDHKLPFLKLLMRGAASDWLAQCGLTTWAAMQPAFKIRFAQTDLKQWQNAAYCWSRKQTVGESTDDYVTNIQRMAALAGLSEGDQGPKIVFMAVVQGLRPDIRAHVLQSGADTLDKLLKAAGIAEVTEPESTTTTEETLRKLVQDVGQLSRRMEGLSVSAVTDRAAYTTPQGKLGQQPGVPTGHGGVFGGFGGSGGFEGYRGGQGRGGFQSAYRGGRGHGGRPAGWSGTQQYPREERPGWQNSCRRCGKRHDKSAYCFAASLNCRGCGIRGHIQRVCMRGQRSGGQTQPQN
jgi:hypothetical protein